MYIPACESRYIFLIYTQYFRAYRKLWLIFLENVENNNYLCFVLKPKSLLRR